MNPSICPPSRRNFVLGLGGAVLAAATRGFGQSSGLSYKGEFTEFGLVTYMWGADWDLPTLIENCEASEVLGVELRVEHAHRVEPTLSPEERAAVRSRFADSRVELLGMGTNGEFHSPEPDEVRRQIENTKHYIKLSHDVGGSGVKVKPNKLPKEVPVEKTLEQIGKSLAELGDYAIGFGQEIRLEVHGDVTDLGHIRSIMEVADRDNVRVCWNSNEQDTQGEGIEANFAKVQEYLGKTVHIREVNEGDYPYETLVKLLVGADYDGWVLLEARTKPEDRVAALKEQAALFRGMVLAARKSAE